ncbi:MAG: CHAT domain-containing protein [Candidatus Aminicenantes bacterium]|jgi:negative regulator of replication initiation
MKAIEETIKKLKDLLDGENFDEARRLIRQLPYEAKELKDNLMEQVGEAERQYNLNQRINDTIERVKDLLTGGNFSEARRLIRQLPSEVRELKDNLLEQVDEAERQYNLKQRTDDTIERVKDLLTGGNVSEARRLIRQLPSEFRELKDNLLVQMDEAEEQFKIKHRIEETIEKVKDLLTGGNFSEARRIIQRLPGKSKKLKDNLLNQVDEIETRDGSKGGILNWLRTHYKKKKKYFSRKSKDPSDKSKLRGHLHSSPDNGIIDAKSQKQINQFYRYTKVDCPQECSLNDEIELSVQLTIKKPLETVVRKFVQITVDNLEKSVKLTLKMTAPDFQVDKSQKTMNVPIDEDSDKVVFKMKPLSVGKQIVEIEIYWNALRIGYFALEIEVMAVLDHPDPPAHIVCYENPGSFIGNAFITKPVKKKTEVYNTLHVTWDSVSKLTYALYPESGPPEGDWEVENIGSQESLQDSLNDLASLITDIAQKKYLNKEEELSCLENMRGIGSVLFEKFIPEYLRFKIKEWPPGEILCISTTEQWIPWELIYDGNGFWGERFLIFRLPRVKGNLQSNDQKNSDEKVKPGTDIINIIHVLGGEIKDIYTERAKNVFKIAESQASIITLEKSNLSALIKQIGKADLLHFTCHGYHKPSLYLQISDKQDKQLNLRFEALKSENFAVKKGSIIFSNACHSSSPSVIFGDFVNFGWEFYRKGAAVFIGTTGTIPTEYAIEFSENFYNRLFKSNAGVAIAFREAKREMHKKNNFFHLLYCLYANPILVR